MFSLSASRKTEVDRNREFQRLLYGWYREGCLYRFLPEWVAESTRETGTYRLNASEGATSLPTAAQRDNEHEKRISIVGNLGEGGISRSGDNLRSRVVEKDRETTIVVETERSYYLSSFTLDLTKQMYEDFGDTALVITDIAEFFGRLHSAANERGLYATSAPVRYIGSVLVLGRAAVSVNPFFDKGIAYKSQKEFRTVLWWAEESLPFLELELGSLVDITKLIRKRDLSHEIKVGQEFFDDLSRDAMRQMDVR